MRYVLDTHALIWFLEGNFRLGENARKIISDPNSQLILPAIVLAEAATKMCHLNLKNQCKIMFRQRTIIDFSA